MSEAGCSPEDKQPSWTQALASLTRNSFGSENVRDLGKPRSVDANRQHGHGCVCVGSVGAVSEDGRQQSLPSDHTCRETPAEPGWPWDDSDRQDAVTLCQFQAWPLRGLEDSALLPWNPATPLQGCPGAPAGGRGHMEGPWRRHQCARAPEEELRCPS